MTKLILISYFYILFFKLQVSILGIRYLFILTICTVLMILISLALHLILYCIHRLT